jgi:protein-tyrosine phosphatase
MFGLFKKKQEAPQTPAFSMLGADMHSHLLPGIDDGSPDVETSIKLIEGLVAQGFSKFICTPHIYKELYPNTQATIKAAYEKLWPALQEKFPGVQLAYAAEYFLDDHFDNLLNSGERLLTLDGNKVLVEYSFMSAPMDLKEKLFALQMEGYQPVIAHPERYTYYASNKNAYHELYDAGCILQVNLLSLTGYYGKPPAQLAHYLLSKGLVQLLGTDLHHDRHLQALQTPALHRQVMQLADSGLLLNSTLL